MSNHTALKVGPHKGWANIPTVTARKYVPKAKKAKQKKKKKVEKKPKKNRPKPSAQIHLSDFIISDTINTTKRRQRKKISFKQKVLRSENAFKIKEELKKHPFIIKQQRIRQKRIEQRKNTNTETEKKTATQTKKAPLITEKKQYSSQKKQIKCGRIHKSVVDVVEFLVNTVCDHENEENNVLNRKQIKNREKRQRKKEMDKLKKIQPTLIEKRNSFKDLHCGSHGNIQLYSEIRSYSDHLISDELNDRVGFLLNKLSLVMDEKQKQQKLSHKLFLCGLKECVKTLRARRNAVIGVIMSSQMEPLPEWSGLDKMIDEIKDLCQRNDVHVVYTLNRKQLNYILKLKPWQGSVSCVTLLDLNVYNETWKRIVEIKNALREQYLMLQYDFIPIYRAISVKPRYIPIYEQKLQSCEKKEEEQHEKQVQSEITQKRSKLSASAAPFEPIPNNMSWYTHSNVFLYNNNNRYAYSSWNGI